MFNLYMYGTKDYMHGQIYYLQQYYDLHAIINPLIAT